MPQILTMSSPYCWNSRALPTSRLDQHQDQVAEAANMLKAGMRTPDLRDALKVVHILFPFLPTYRKPQSLLLLLLLRLQALQTPQSSYLNLLLVRLNSLNTVLNRLPRRPRLELLPPARNVRPRFVIEGIEAEVREEGAVGEVVEVGEGDGL